MDEHTISPVGNRFHATPHDQGERPCVCNDGWVTIGQLVVNEEGEEVEEFALYLCRRCAGT